MTAEILRALIEANIAAAAVILVVLGLGGPIRRTFGARAAYGLWIAPPVAALATLLPARVLPQTPASAMPADLDLFTLMLVAEAWGPAVPEAPAINWPALALAVWLAGAAAAIGILLFRHRRALAGLGALSRKLGDAFGLYRSPGASGPAVVGILRPRLIVPADFEARFEPDEQRLILAHETEHLNGHHARVNALAALLAAVNWFNPLILLAARRIRTDQELACDAAVLARHPGARAAYGRALLKTQFDPAPMPLGCHWPPQGKSPLKERLAMLKFPTPSRARLYGGAALAAALAAGSAAAAWAAQPAAAPAPSRDAVSAQPTLAPEPAGRELQIEVVDTLTPAPSRASAPDQYAATQAPAASESERAARAAQARQRADERDSRRAEAMAEMRASMPDMSEIQSEIRQAMDEVRRTLAEQDWDAGDYENLSEEERREIQAAIAAARESAAIAAEQAARAMAEIDFEQLTRSMEATRAERGEALERARQAMAQAQASRAARGQVGVRDPAAQAELEALRAEVQLLREELRRERAQQGG